jgi:hypothetical protein
VRAWAVILVALSTPAFAHDADVIYARLEPDGDSLLEIVTLTHATLGLLIPIESDAFSQLMLDDKALALKAGVWDDLPLTAGGVSCSRSAETARVEEGFISLTARWRCPDGTLRQDFKILRILPANYRVVLGSQLMGERGRQFAQGVFTALEVPRPKPPGGYDGLQLREGLGRGVRDAATFDAFLSIALCFLTIRARRRVGLRLVALLLGAGAVMAARVGPGWAAAAIAGSSLVLAAGAHRVWAEVGALLAGVGVGLRAGVWSVSDGAGWLVGVALVAAVVAIGCWPLAGLLERRPRALQIVSVACAAMVCFVAGLRLAS